MYKRIVKVPLSLLVILLIGVHVPPVSASQLVSPWDSNGSYTYYNGGNVGIGTNTPVDPLQIVNKNAGTYDTNWGKMLIGDDGGSHWFGSWVYKNGSQITSASNNLVSNGYLDTTYGWGRRNPNLETWTIGNYVTNTNQGNFQIAYSAPQNGVAAISNWKPVFKINSSGTVYVNELVVKNSANGWPDYVFEDNYQLKSISELEQYIRDNRHLPNVPSEETVKESGISVGEMQVKQMEKIEELTLYTIQQQKEIDSLKADIQYLKSKLN